MADTKNDQINKENWKDEPFDLFTRSIIGAIFLVISFNLSYGAFFRDNPLYGVKFLAEFIISMLSAAVGFFFVPIAFMQVKEWIEDVIEVTVSNIVGDFWEQQTDRINKRRMEKEREKEEEEKRKLEEKMERSILLDTSVLVDGRILDIVKSGFLDKVLIIPTAVMNELHLISDNKNKLKRERGRRGLDVAKKLKNVAEVMNPTIDSDNNKVDKRLLEFAKKNDIKLMTLDFNLNKLAKAQGVDVININELVEAVKVNVIPGERLEIEVQHPGESKKQGVGYMQDGTMVVIEDAKELIGKSVEVKVSKVIQSKAGKIIFSEIIDDESK